MSFCDDPPLLSQFVSRFFQLRANTLSSLFLSPSRSRYPLFPLILPSLKAKPLAEMGGEGGGGGAGWV